MKQTAHTYRVILAMTMLVVVNLLAQNTIWQPDIMNFPHFIYLYNNADDKTQRAGVVQEFNKILDQSGTPFIEGDKCYFIYRGSVDSAISVVGFFNNWQPEKGQLNRLGTTNLYFRQYTFPVDARLDYKFVKDGEWILDPENPLTVEGGFGLNSEMRMPKYKESPWTSVDSTISGGRIFTQSWESSVLPGQRTYHVYLPAEYDPAKRYPLLLTQDGSDYLKFGKINVIADNLIAAGKIQPLIIVLVDPITRTEEYGANPKYLQMIADEIYPMIKSQYRISRKRMDTGILGDSFGGLAAFFVGLQRPDIFGMMAGQSGHYAFRNNWIIEYAQRLDTATRPSQLAYIQVGAYERTLGEHDFYQASRTFRDALQNHEVAVHFTEAPEGHSWAYWRRLLPDILMTFYGTDGTANTHE